ncbi:MAG: mechanosensitive ion channel family protein [Alphaproteobacteria bacterium]|tara:strand:+ start:1727 stop:2773 length:1047 start_codon:yes stop_codon:yes gene_type:complete
MNLDLISTNYFDIALYGGVNILVSILLYLFFAWMKNRIVARIKGKGNLFQIVNIILSRFHNIGVFLLLFLFTSQIIFHNYSIVTTIQILLSLIFFIQAAYIIDGVATYLITNSNKFETNKKKSQVKNAVSLIKFIARSIIWSIALLLCVENIGIDITALVAGLGIGGIAIALAAQNILSDLFASLAIVLDKPFEIDDYIVVGDISGTVEQIGIKTTRIRALSGEELVCSNADLLGSRVRNYKRMKERRAIFELGVVYQTPHNLLTKIPEIIEKIIENAEFARFDRANFKSFGDSSLLFEIVFYVSAPGNDYNEYMKVQQGINYEIFKKFEELKIDFAYPTQTLHISKE